MLRQTVRLTVCGVVAVVWASVVGTAGAQYERISPMVKTIKMAEPSVVGIFLPNSKTVSGTGIIIDKRGLIVTNHHVVGNNRNVVVRFKDGSKIEGQVFVDRPELDLAFVRVRAEKELPAIAPKNDNDVLLGETVIAIGHPLGYTDTVSAGIVSSLGREIDLPTGGKLKNLIQTNAAINPGNSGGPLFNINGELIGINSAIRSDAQGIAFSIHCTTVVNLLKDSVK